MSSAASFVTRAGIAARGRLEGCLHRVYAPVGASYRRVFNARVDDVEFAVINGRVAIRAECAGASAENCPHVLLWNGHRLAERP